MNERIRRAARGVAPAGRVGLLKQVAEPLVGFGMLRPRTQGSLPEAGATLGSGTRGRWVPGFHDFSRQVRVSVWETEDWPKELKTARD